MTDRKKPGVALWATVVLVVVLVGYPLSFGPACWLIENRSLSEPALNAFKTFYKPIYDATMDHSDWFSDAIISYVRCCSGEMAWRVWEQPPARRTEKIFYKPDHSVGP